MVMNYGTASISSSNAYSKEPIRRSNMKVKKPGFFKRWLLRQLDSVHYHEQTEPSQVLVKESPNIDQPDRAIQFTIYNANGGRVVETRRYDRQKDRHHRGLYIITSDQEFGREIDKIITMEALR
jgi:hypothetical protein